MRSPDDDDEVHNSISKLLWLRQRPFLLTCHLSLCDLLFGGSSYGIVMLQVLQRSFSMLCPSLEFHLITTKLRTVLQKSRRREILKMPLFLYYYGKKVSLYLTYIKICTIFSSISTHCQTAVKEKYETCSLLILLGYVLLLQILILGFW